MVRSPQTPLGRTARLLDLVPYLTSHQGVELKKLADGFGVSQSQMVADLTTLWMCGLPGYTPLELMELSFDSGFVTIHNAETLSRPRTLSDEESIALLLGLDLLIQSLPTDRADLKDLALALVEKLSARSNLPAKLTAAPAVPEGVRFLIESAIAKNQSIEITYHSSYSDSITVRIVHPLEFRGTGGFEYVWGVCESARGFRTFRLDRIQSAKLSTKKTPFLVGVERSDETQITYTLRAHSRLREVMERFSLSKNRLAKDVQISSFSTEWIRRCVLASAGSVEVLAPPEIRRDVARAAGLILERYKTH